MTRTFGAICAIQLLATPALADVDLDPVNACFDAATQNQTNPSQCIDAAHDPCMDNAAETPAVATLCFQTARGTWSGGIGSVMAETMSSADERLAAVAQIETKYDLLANLLQCDRVEELSIAASDLGGNAIALQTARCQSAASALTYMRLYLRTRSLTTE